MTRLVIIIICLILLVYFLWNLEPTKRTLFKSGYDGEYYSVVEKYGASESANQMARLNRKVMAFLKDMKEKYRVNTTSEQPAPIYDFDDSERLQINDSGEDRLQGIIRRILENYNPEVIHENDPDAGDGTSYTIDKGKKLIICLRNKKTKELHDDHTMMFVILHELSHMGNKNWGHKRDFWEIFKFILHEAQATGHHQPFNYRYRPMDYCGLLIDYNPYFDDMLKKIWLV